MIFQGEIYNKKELNSGDDDAIVASRVLVEHGPKGFAGVRGSFAISHEDPGKVTLTRDQFGTIPLYYATLPGSDRKIVYGSSVLELLDKGVPRKLSKEGLYSYLSYGCPYSPYTLIEGVRSVPPGCAVVLENGKAETIRYWNPSFDVKPWNPQELDEALKAELERAVCEQTNDGPAAFLSGGIDSSAIVALWRSKFSGEIRTYCVTHEDARTDERNWARMVAERNGTKHVELLLEDKKISEWLDDAIKGYDQPSYDGLNFWFATRLLREQTSEKVVLSGEGGDELFMGYGQFIKHQLAYKYWRLMRHLPRFAGAAVDAFAPNEKFRKLAMLAGFRGDPYYTSRRILNDWQISKVLNPDLLFGSARLEDLETMAFDVLPKDLLNRISWLEMQTSVADMWMRDGYQTAASNGLAIRTPLCDVRVVELLCSVPGRMKCDDKISKPLLVRASGEGLPEACVTRKKQGFSLPFDRYFTGEIKDRIDEFISGKNTMLFNPEVVHDMGLRYRAGKLYWSRIWILFMVENWCRVNGIDIA